MFFVVGSARSGTTLLRTILNAHSQVAVPPESRFVVELWRGTDEVDVASFLESLAHHRRFQTWGLPIDAVTSELGARARAPYREAIEATYRAYARARRKDRWGDKTPRYIEHIPLLSRLFPHARFVHQIRDGRNVALSYADVPFGPKTAAGAAHLWRKRVSDGLRSGRELGDERYMEIRYEELVADPDVHVKALCQFLEIEFEPAMIEADGAPRDLLPRHTLYNPHVGQRPVAQLRSWEQDMGATDVEMFEAVAGDLLSELGYPRRFPSPRARAHIAAWLGRRGLPVGRLQGARARRTEDFDAVTSDLTEEPDG